LPVFSGINTMEKAETEGAKVAIIMGSQSDWDTMSQTAQALDQLQVPYHVEVVSAHRTPQKLMDFASQAADRGFEVIVAGAGGAAHLPGMAASMTHLPVLGVPVQSKSLNGMDSLLSIAQMPKGVAVGTLAIGSAGAFNAGLLAAQILALKDPALTKRLEQFRQQQTQAVLDTPDPRA
jgi:5-(carboxyamino)imidazole ribonucleotide mutase